MPNSIHVEFQRRRCLKNRFEIAVQICRLVD